MFSRKSLTGIAAAVAVGAVALTAGSASAALAPQYQAVKSGTAGYYTVTGIGVKNIDSTVTLNSAATNIGGVGTGGIGDQLCDPNNGFGLQLGAVANPNSTFSIEYQTGTLAGANADNCVGNGVLPNPHILNQNLTAIPVGDSVQLYISYSTYRKTNGTRAQGRGQLFGMAAFQAYDETSGFELYSADVWKLPYDLNINSAGVGVQQDTTGMSACTPTVTDGYNGGSGACNDVADFSNVFLNGKYGIFGFGPGLTSYGHTIQVITTGGGNKANAALVAPNGTLTPAPTGTGESAFSVFAGQVTNS